MSAFKDYVGNVLQIDDIVVTSQRGTNKGLKLAKVVGFTAKMVNLQEVGGEQKHKFSGFTGDGDKRKATFTMVDDIRRIYSSECVVVDGALAFQYQLTRK